jgi:hypothetical protein
MERLNENGNVLPKAQVQAVSLVYPHLSKVDRLALDIPAPELALLNCGDIRFVEAVIQRTTTSDAQLGINTLGARLLAPRSPNLVFETLAKGYL